MLLSAALSLFFLWSSGTYNQQSKKPMVTIWVHGTKTVSQMLAPTFFRTIDGLKHASEYDKKNHLRQAADNLSKSDPKQFPFEQIYIFGWSGKLSFEERKKASKNLHDEIVLFLEKYKKKHGFSPKLRIITHSHGGNVAMNLEKIDVEELVLIACPVQEQTKHRLKDPIFKNIYHFYCNRDIVQVMDPQGIHHLKKNILSLLKIGKPLTPLFSENKFPGQSNLKQIQVIMPGIYSMHPHLFLILDDFVSQLPNHLSNIRNNKNIDKQKNNYIINLDKNNKKSK